MQRAVRPVATKSVSYVTPKKMLHWVESYKVISGYDEISWPSYIELLACFKRLVDSKNIGDILEYNYPGLREVDGEFWYEKPEASTRVNDLASNNPEASAELSNPPKEQP